MQISHKGEENLRNIFLQAPVAMCLFRGKDHVVEIANDRMLELWGKTAEAVMNKPVFEGLPEAKSQGYEELLENVYSTGEKFTAYGRPVTLPRGDKLEVVYINFVYEAFREGDGKISGVMALATDVTQQILAQNRAEEKEEQLRIALEGGELGTFDFYPKTGKLVWSARTKELFGLSPHAEVNLDTYYKGIHPDDKERTRASLQTAMDNQAENLYENEYRTIGILDGKLRWVRAKGKLTFDGEGNVTRLTGIVQDITRQKEILHSLQLQSLVLDRMDEGVSVSDENGIILFTNPSEDAMFGYGEGELVGKHVTTQNSYPPEENAKIVSTVISELNKKGFWSGEWHNLKKDGSAFYTHSFITSLDTDGKKLFVCVQRDITAEKKAQELLAYRTAILEAQNDAIPDGILIVDTKGKILSFNKHFIELWKIPGDIIEGKDDTLALEYAKEQLSNPNAFLENLHYSYTDPEKKSPEEFWLKDGRIIEGYGNPVIGENGYNYGWAWYFRNITERKKAEQELKLTKEQLELTFRNVPAGISLFDNSGKILFANDNAARLVGYSSAEEMMAEKDVSQLRQRADEKNVMLNEKGGAFLMEQSPTLIALTTGKAAEAIIQILSRNGQSSTWVLSKATAIFDEHRRVCMVLTASTDITAQKVSEQKIRQSEEQLRTLSEQLEMKVKERTEELDVLNKTLLIQNETFKQAEESSKQGSYSFNLATGTLIYSDNLYRLLGYKVGEFSPSLEEFNKHVHPDDQEYVTKSAEKVLQTISADDWKYRMIKKDGGLIHIRATGRIISLNNENLLVGTLQDITADVLLKQTLQEKNLELERSNEDLQQFAHVASHDLKEPLRKIKTFGSLLTSEVGSDLSTKANTYLKKMENAADRMFNMIDGVLLYSSLNDGHLLDERVNLYELLRGITVDLEVLIDQKRATLLHTDLPTIRGSKILLNQLFYNLVYNALKFSKADRNPEITIHSQYVSGGGLEGWVTNTSSRKDYVQIEIQDNGIGFENSDAERIFKTFTRLNSKDLYEGTGLGLALCKKIVERHQGIIYAQGRPGEGATFYVILPK